MTPADLSAILSSLGGPYALLAAVAVVVLGPKLTPLLAKLGPLLAAIRRTPEPLVEPSKPVDPATPLLDLLKLLIARRAAASGKSAEVAFNEWVAEQITQVAKKDDTV